MRTLCYRLPQGPTVSVTAAERLLDEVDLYLAPHYEKTSMAEGEWMVVTRLYGQGATGQGAVQHAFGERFKLTPGGDDAWLIQHEGGPDQVWYTDRRRVEVILTPAIESYSAAQGVYASVRQIALREAARSGLAVLHAAAVDVTSGTVLLCGEKGAGKTTLALALLAQGAAYMASDRVMVWRHSSGLRIAGWPGSFRLAPEAIDLALEGEVAARLKGRMKCSQSTSSYWFGGKFRFPPGEILDFGGWKRRVASTPGLLVELDPTLPSDCWEHLSGAEVERMWGRHLVPGRPLLRLAGETPPNPLPAETSGFMGARMGRSSPARMARLVLALARQAAS